MTVLPSYCESDRMGLYTDEKAMPGMSLAEKS